MEILHIYIYIKNNYLYQFCFSKTISKPKQSGTREISIIGLTLEKKNKTQRKIIQKKKT